MADLNDEQRAAVDHANGSLLLSAGAGSGKTRVLVERYLKHLADGVPVRGLVAITFTEKAAREMRKRIRESGVNDPHLETAAIDTFHGYCAALLRKHAAAVNLDPKFTVLDDAFGAMLRREAIGDGLRELLFDHAPTADDLKELIVLHGWTAILAAVESFLHSPDTAAWARFAARTPAQIAADWTTQARNRLPAFAKKALAESPAIAALKNVKAATPEGKRILASVLKEIDRYNVDPFTVKVAELCETAKVNNASTGKKLYGNDAYESVRDGYKALRSALTGSLAELLAVPANLEAAAAVALRMTHVALHVEALWAERKKKGAMLDFHDMLVKTRDLLKENAAVRASVQGEIQYLLLDELQDTDPVQMEIAELLLGDRFKTGGLFAVGDAKQSIYRFRGADVGQFESLRAGMPPQSRRELRCSFRSGSTIIGFVNSLCRAWFPGESPLIATRENPEPGAVEFLWASHEEKISAEEMREAEATALAKRIRELIEDGYESGTIVLLFRTLSSVGIYEMALRYAGIDYYLVGGRAFFAQQEVYDLANVLGAIENPLDGLAVVGTLRSPICALSDDAVTAIAWHDDGPWAGLLAEPELLPPAERECFLRARRNLTAWRQQKDSLPIARLIQRILADSGYDAALLFEPLGDRKLANLWKLQAIAREFDAAGRNLAEFAEHLADLVSRPPHEEQAATVPEEASHVVRIMSVHQAKGLEFPIVIVPDIGSGRGEKQYRVAEWHRTLGAVVSVPTDSDEEEIGYPAWPCTLARFFDREADDEESLRVLYVACTRAKERLILSASARAGEPAMKSPWMTALSEAYDLASGKCLGDGPSVPVRVL